MARYGGKQKGYQQYFHFDSDQYIRELKSDLKLALTRVRDDLYSMIRKNAIAVDYSSNSVAILRGSSRIVTSDAERKKAVVDSIYRHRISSLESKGNLTAVVTAIGKNWQEDHIGMYYEFGTGLHRPSSFFTGEGKYWNPFRHTKEIVTRSVFVTHLNTSDKYGYSGLRESKKYAIGFSGDKKGNSSMSVVPYRGIDNSVPINGIRYGTWVDMGGNTRLTRSSWGGRRTKRMNETIGDGTPAHHWFRKSMFQNNSDNQLNDEFKKMLEKQIKKGLVGKTLFRNFTIRNIML